MSAIFEFDVARRVIFKADSGGCAHYRAVLPARVADATVRSSFLVKRSKIRPDDVAFMNMGSETTVFQRPVKPDIPQALQALQAQGRRGGVEIDDDVFNLSYQNPVYSYWPKEDLRLLAKALKQAQFVTCSTKPLAMVLKGRGAKNIFVIPNAIDIHDINMELAERKANAEAGILRIGWAGSWTHASDVRLMLPALSWVAAQPNVRLCLYGYNPFKPDMRQSTTYKHRGGDIEFHAWEDSMQQHYENISSLDIAFAPVINNTFNASKSNLKWLEHAIFKTPVICSKVPAYENVRHGETGFLARNEADFMKYIKTLLQNPQLRADMGAAAQADALAHFTLDKTAPLWRETICGSH